MDECFEANYTLLVTIRQLCKNGFLLGSAILVLEILDASFSERRDACDVVDASPAEVPVYRRISFLTKNCSQNILAVSFLLYEMHLERTKCDC